VLGFEYTGYTSHVIFGVGIAEGDGFVDAVEQLGARRIVVVAAEAEADLAERITQNLDTWVVGRFSEVRPHVPIEVAGAARDLARRVDADSLLSIGGGSTTGTAKAIAMELGLPIIAVPTTYAGCEVTPVW